MRSPLANIRVQIHYFFQIYKLFAGHVESTLLTEIVQLVEEFERRPRYTLHDGDLTNEAIMTMTAENVYFPSLIAVLEPIRSKILKSKKLKGCVSIQTEISELEMPTENWKNGNKEIPGWTKEVESQVINNLKKIARKIRFSNHERVENSRFVSTKDRDPFEMAIESWCELVDNFPSSESRSIDIDYGGGERVYISHPIVLPKPLPFISLYRGGYNQRT